MKKTVSSLILFCSVPFAVRAQVDHGGFGNFFAGSVYNTHPQLQNKLGSDDLLGNGLQLNTAAFVYGGAGYAIQPSGIVLGGGGYTYSVFSGGPNGNSEVNMSNGVFNLGYLVLNTRKWIGFPYLGFGAFATDFKIKNSTSDRVMFLGTDAVAPGQRAKYLSGGLAFDAGFGIKHFQKNKNVKAVVGLDAGVSFFPSLFKWQNTDTHSPTTGMGTPFATAAYLRLTIGMGAFYYRESR